MTRARVSGDRPATSTNDRRWISGERACHHKATRLCGVHDVLQKLLVSIGTPPTEQPVNCKKKRGRPTAAPLTQSVAVASASSIFGLRMTISAPFSGR
jgi:hypothetical protein